MITVPFLFVSLRDAPIQCAWFLQEYLYRKSLEGKERAAYERKRAVKKALEGKSPHPPHSDAGDASAGVVGAK